eukprot:scaffold7630_cov376-Prasinococcus_capsulatus_cf.AAC.1
MKASASTTRRAAASVSAAAISAVVSVKTPGLGRRHCCSPPHSCCRPGLPRQPEQQTARPPSPQ